MVVATRKRGRPAGSGTSGNGAATAARAQVLLYRVLMKEGKRVIREGSFIESNLATILNKWNSIVTGLAAGEVCSFTIWAAMGKPPKRH